MRDKNQYIKEYKEKYYSRVVVDVRKEIKDRWQQASKAAGEALAEYVKKAVEARIES